MVKCSTRVVSKIVLSCDEGIDMGGNEIGGTVVGGGFSVIKENGNTVLI